MSRLFKSSCLFNNLVFQSDIFLDLCGNAHTQFGESDQIPRGSIYIIKLQKYFYSFEIFI